MIIYTEYILRCYKLVTLKVGDGDAERIAEEKRREC